VEGASINLTNVELPCDTRADEVLSDVISLNMSASRVKQSNVPDDVNTETACKKPEFGKAVHEAAPTGVSNSDTYLAVNKARLFPRPKARGKYSFSDTK